MEQKIHGPFSERPYQARVAINMNTRAYLSQLSIIS